MSHQLEQLLSGDSQSIFVLLKQWEDEAKKSVQTELTDKYGNDSTNLKHHDEYQQLIHNRMQVCVTDFLSEIEFDEHKGQLYYDTLNGLNITNEQYTQIFNAQTCLSAILQAHLPSASPQDIHFADAVRTKRLEKLSHKVPLLWHEFLAGDAEAGIKMCSLATLECARRGKGGQEHVLPLLISLLYQSDISQEQIELFPLLPAYYQQRYGTRDYRDKFEPSFTALANALAIVSIMKANAKPNRSFKEADEEYACSSTQQKATDNKEEAWFNRSSELKSIIEQSFKTYKILEGLTEDEKRCLHALIQPLIVILKKGESVLKRLEEKGSINPLTSKKIELLKAALQRTPTDFNELQAALNMKRHPIADKLFKKEGCSTKSMMTTTHPLHDKDIIIAILKLIKYDICDTTKPWAISALRFGIFGGHKVEGAIIPSKAKEILDAVEAALTESSKSNYNEFIMEDYLNKIHALALKAAVEERINPMVWGNSNRERYELYAENTDPTKIIYEDLQRPSASSMQI